MGNKRPALGEILSEDFWRKRVEVGQIKPVIPWKEGFLFLLPLGGVLGTPILLGLINATGKASAKFWSKLGVKCTHTSEIYFERSYEDIVFSLIVTLKKMEKGIISAEDTSFGCCIVAEIPQDLKSYPGTVKFEIKEMKPDQTLVIGISEIKGQMTDWGKGRSILDEVSNSIKAYIQKEL